MSVNTSRELRSRNRLPGSSGKRTRIVKHLGSVIVRDSSGASESSSWYEEAHETVSVPDARVIRRTSTAVLIRSSYNDAKQRRRSTRKSKKLQESSRRRFSDNKVDAIEHGFKRLSQTTTPQHSPKNPMQGTGVDIQNILEAIQSDKKQLIERKEHLVDHWEEERSKLIRKWKLEGEMLQRKHQQQKETISKDVPEDKRKRRPKCVSLRNVMPVNSLVTYVGTSWKN